MGSSPKAVIFYGVFLGTEGTWHKDNDYGDIPSIITDGEIDEAQERILDPSCVRSEGMGPEWDAYLAKSRALKDKIVLDVVMGGDFESGTLDHSLAIAASITRSDWDCNPMTLTDKPLFTMDPKALGWDALLREWAEKLGIPWDKIENANPEGPRWLVVTAQG